VSPFFLRSPFFSIFPKQLAAAVESDTVSDLILGLPQEPDEPENGT